MRKAISLFLAVSVLCFATSAFATTPDPTNAINTTQGTTPRTGSTTFNTAGSGSMPCFRTGDTVAFNLSKLTTGKELTVISYKVGAESSLVDSKVQYINQYTVDSASKTIKYVVRDIDSGVYVLKFNDTEKEVATFYYKVGNPDVQLLTATNDAGNATAYRATQYGSTWSIGFIAKATMTGGGTAVKFADIAANPGFKIKKGNGTPVTRYIDGATLDEFFDNLITDRDIELSGDFSVIYGVTVYDVPGADKANINATAVIDALE